MREGKREKGYGRREASMLRGFNFLVLVVSEVQDVTDTRNPKIQKF